MIKINCLLFAISLSLFTIILSKTESCISFKKNAPVHNFQNDNSINFGTLPTNIKSLKEFRHFEKQKKQTNGTHLNVYATLNGSLLENNIHYLKVCDFFNLNLTVSIIIYPFHSFL
tara:strand:- start:478 stop:825 length:348 start_codon:yes stop_codon:yes gene_type:complete